MWWEEMLEPFEASAVTRSGSEKDPREDVDWTYPIGYESTMLKKEFLKNTDREVSIEMLLDDSMPNAHYNDHWTYPLGYDKEEQIDLPHLLFSLDDSVITQFIHGYTLDRTFKTAWKETATAAETLLTASHFHCGNNRLLFFMDADWKMWLCVPQNMVNLVLRLNHDIPYEGSHRGPKCFIS
ncbi:hypothetical protein C8J56DRAFT_893304 [Mycena floridula]|nr:hypothetical protein C8J56DRAFT_893304 [Mycena floridula]